MTGEHATRPASAGIVITLLGAALGGAVEELTRSIIGDVEGAELVALRLGTGVCIFAVGWWAWTEPRRREAIGTCVVVLTSSLASILDWYPNGHRWLAWLAGAAVLGAYLAVSLVRLDAAGRRLAVDRGLVVAFLALIAIPATAGMAGAQVRFQPTCDESVVVRKLRPLLPDPIEDKVVGAYLAHRADLDCLAEEAGPHAHGRMFDLGFTGGTEGPSLLVFDEHGAASVVPAQYRAAALHHLRSNPVVHMSMWQRGNTHLHMFKFDDGRCTVTYDYGHETILLEPARAMAFLALVGHHEVAPRAYQQDVRGGSMPPAVVVTFTERRGEESEYVLALDGFGDLIAPQGVSWVKERGTCPAGVPLGRL